MSAWEKEKKQFVDILDEINAILEGGDVVLDFEHSPSKATTLRIISDIVGNALRGMKEREKLLDALNKIDFHDTNELSK